ncbi:MAG: efflux RND transporter permease subunit [Caldilineaceae bacterium]|nr:efflux RND transporter permease subunit [Caldilineaceae bacterium]
MKIWDLSIRQPVFMTMILLAGVILGLLSYFTMPVNLFPEVEFPVIVAVTVYPGASPEEVEDQVTTVLEEDLSAIGGIESLTSRSSEGVSTVILQFDLDTSVDSVSQEVQEKIGLLRNRLPDGIQEPVVRRFNPSDSPILLFGIADSTGQLSPTELRDLVEDEVQAPLQRIGGVAAVEVDGGRIREIKVNLNQQSLQALRITPQQVIAALQTENLNVPGGTIRADGAELLLRTPGNFQSLEDVRNVIVSQRGSPVYLRDVAEVEDGFEEIDSITRLNGEESIVIRVRKQSGTNTAAVSNDVKDALIPIQAANPQLEIAIAGDEAIVVEESTNGAVEDVLWGALLAGLVIFLFFRDVRNTVITSSVCP